MKNIPADTRNLKFNTLFYFAAPSGFEPEKPALE